MVVQGRAFRGAHHRQSARRFDPGSLLRTLAEISSTGFGEYWTREFRPYLRAAAQQFAPERESLTDRLLKKKNRPPTINSDERR